MYLQKVQVISKKNTTKRAGSGSGTVSQRDGSADLDPQQDVTDPEHW
jgi:hypothetical protein